MLIDPYYYDPFGRRLWKEVAGTKTYFSYADEGLVGEYDGTGSEIKTYGYKPGSTWTTDPLFMKVGTDYYFYQNDHLGTPQKLTTSNGAVVWSAKYTSFGEATVEVETVASNLRFPGQYYDVDTRLYYNYHRYYDSWIGRYLGPDPIGFQGSQVTVYNYVGNNPLKFVDPEGLWSAGVGFYYGPGGDASWNETICCKNNKTYKVKYIMACFGGGLGLFGKVPLGVGLGGVSSSTGCVKTGFFFRRSFVFGVLEAGISGSLSRVSGDISFGVYGGETTWKICYNKVFSKKLVKECCD